MKEFEINCVTRASMGRSHEHITHIGNSLGKWRISTADAAAHIAIKASAFFIKEKRTGLPVYLHIVRESGKTPYLRVFRNEDWSDELLSLPECPGGCIDI